MVNQEKDSEKIMKHDGRYPPLAKGVLRKPESAERLPATIPENSKKLDV